MAFQKPAGATVLRSHLLISQWVAFYYIAQADFKLAVFLPQLPENWDYKHMLSCQASSPPNVK